MKKIVSFFMATILVVSLCACGATGNSTASTDNTSSGAEESTQPEQQTEAIQTTPSEEVSEAITPVSPDGEPVVYFTSDIISCFLCGCAAGLLIHLFYKDKEFFDFKGFSERESHDTHPNLIIRYLLNFWRNVKTTGLYFLYGILLSALFQRYVPQDVMVNVFGGNEAWGVLMAATIGVPLYACGGGTIPLLQSWLMEGMSMGSAAAFMITGPATKITNLGALKIVMGIKRFLIYIAFVMLFSFLSGLIINLIL